MNSKKRRTVSSSRQLEILEGEAGQNLPTRTLTENISDDDSGPATAGVIEKIELTNFMCHDLFTLELGPQINFIIGRNGAGKSAILTGISVGLGAKATDTNRGSSIKDLIKNDKQTAKTLIVLKNEGRYAYCPEIYGKKIRIKRKFQREGGNQYSIESADGKVISNKKSVIDEILAKFDITVDNPIAFLSQDKAREFLHSTSDTKKFEYFMTGTNITGIKKHVETSKNYIDVITAKESQAIAQYKATENTFSICKAEFEKFSTTASIRNKLNIAHGKLYWFNVNQLEHKILRSEQKTQRLLEEIQQLEAKIDQIDQKSATSEDERIKLQQAQKSTLEDFETAKNKEIVLRDQRNAILETIKQNEQEISNTTATIKNLEKDLEKCKSSIDAEQKRIDEINGGTEDILKRQLQTNTLEIENLNRSKANAIHEKSKIKIDEDNEVKGLDEELKEMDRNFSELALKHQELKDSQKDKFRPWGYKMNNLIDLIKKTKSWHKEPVGPIGLYVNVKEEFKQWKDLINTVLNRSLDSFLVTDEHDRRILDRLMKEIQFSKNILVRKLDKFDYKQGKPNGLTTLEDAITVTNEDVLYTLIDFNKIEKNVIAKEAEAEKFARQDKVQSVYIHFGTSGNSAQRVSLQNGTVRFDPVYYDTSIHKLGGGIDPRDELSNLESQMSSVRKLIELKRHEANGIRRGYRQRVQKIEDVIISCTSKMGSLTNENFRIQEKLSEDGDFAKIESLKANIEDLNRQIAANKGVSQGLQEDIKNSLRSKEQLDIEITKLKRETKAKRTIAQTAEQNLIEFETDMETGINEKSSFIHEKAQCEKKIISYRETHQEASRLLKEAISSAERICKREIVTFESDDNKDSIMEEYKELERQVRQAESSFGKSIQEVQEALDIAIRKRADAEQRMERLRNTRRRLNDNLSSRIKYFEKVKDDLVRTAKRTYDRALDLREYTGNLEFNFEKETLTLLALTAKDLENRSVGSLSGGEKSYIQIAMLLAIWKVMNSTIRGLDEFDVFMDSVNRSMCIKLLLSELRKNPKSQNIFITPQDIAIVGDLAGSDIKIHTMMDPRSEV